MPFSNKNKADFHRPPSRISSHKRFLNRRIEVFVLHDRTSYAPPFLFISIPEAHRLNRLPICRILYKKFFPNRRRMLFSFFSFRTCIELAIPRTFFFAQRELSSLYRLRMTTLSLFANGAEQPDAETWAILQYFSILQALLSAHSNIFASVRPLFLPCNRFFYKML